MTTSNQINLSHVYSNFDLLGTLEPLDVAPTATGGAGINNRHQFRSSEHSVPKWKTSGTEYVKKYIDKEKESQISRSRVSLSAYSTTSIDTLYDVDDASTIGGALPTLNELDSETTQNIYSTYFNVPNRPYDHGLTITKYRESILEQLNINPVVIIQGPTGCGKTTQVPQYILDFHQSKGTYCNIIVTQPRKIAAISIARRVCHERKWQLGTIVGYQVAMDAKTSSDTRLCYVTTGVLLEKLVNAKRMDMYTHIIIDEVHERNQDIDFALLLVKKFLNTNSQKVKVVLMSATFHTTQFANYFSLSARGDAAPIIDISGKSKDVSEHYVDELKTLLKRIPEYDVGNPYIDPCLYDGVLKLMYIFDKIEKAEQGVPMEAEYAPKRGAVLIFLPGYEEISTLSDKLKTASFNRNFWIIPLHSSITVEEQTKVFRDAPSDQRKVILSTNIAESSITVPDVKYVIDFCLTKNLVTDPSTNYTCLQLEWASKANCIQRKGRAGRVDIGKVYRMVPRKFYTELPEYGIPEIKRCPLTSTILHIKKLNLCEPQEMLAFALDPPDLSDIGSAILQLKEALALTPKGSDPFDGDLTFIGRVMSHLPLDVKFSKLIIFGYVFHCLEECIIIAASLSLQSFFSKPFQKVLDAYRSRLAWADGTFSDCLSHLNAFNMWKQLSVQGQFLRPGCKGEGGWAETNFIQLRRIKEVDLLVKDIKKRLERLQIFVDQRHRYGSEESNILIIKMVIAGAFFPYYYLQEELDEQKINREINENDPHSTVMIHGLPKHGILYASALKDKFSCCSDNINIEFEGTKAYIRFQRNEASTSTVLNPVYLAVKMRKLRIPLTLAVFSEKEAERKAMQLMASKREESNSKLASNRVTVMFGKVSAISKVPLPPLDRTIEKIFITYVNNCGHFWARYVTETINSLYCFLETTINAERGKNLKPLGMRPQINTLYLAPYFEERSAAMYYRAQVIGIRGDEAKVFFVDYGNVEFKKIGELREIDDSTPDVRETPALAFECQLSELKPSSIKSPTGDWSNEANIWCKRNVSGIELTAKIYSVVQDTVRLELLKYNQDRSILNINKELIRLGYAEPAEESLLSKQNHEIRLKTYDYSESEKAILDNLTRDVELIWKETAECTKTTDKVFLKGPFNPLEVSYGGLTYLDRSKRVKIERDSVNSVSFNAEPQDSYTTMLVAAHVGVGHDNLDLMTRNTTLMPKLRGLPSIICLLFAPFVEVRADKALKSYTGALCGLGYDDNGDAIYSDHDIEIPFDIEFNYEDIIEINAIRMGFNLLLDSKDDILKYQSNVSALMHETTRTTIIKLLQKKREPKEPEYFTRPYQWNQIKGKVLEPDVMPDGDCPFVFPLHRPPALASFITVEKKTMKKHLRDLYRIAEEPQNRQFRVIRCQLCSLDITSARDLVCHLDSEKHQRKEEEFRQGLY